jgi:release factor glutamine methyltransferase
VAYTNVLDLFTGSGALAIAAMRCRARWMTAVDISRRALLTARLNARRNRARVRSLHATSLRPWPSRRST